MAKKPIHKHYDLEELGRTELNSTPRQLQHSNIALSNGQNLVYSVLQKGVISTIANFNILRGTVCFVVATDSAIFYYNECDNKLL